MKKFLAVLVAFTVLFNVTPGFANVLDSREVVDSKLSEPAGSNWVTGEGRHDLFIKWASSDNYVKKSIGMFHRGLSNTAAGWTELFLQPYRWSKNSPVLVGQVYGLLAGVTWAVLRTTSGALDVATFWIPGFRGVPLTKPVLGLHAVHEYETIEDPTSYNDSVSKAGFYWGSSDE